MTALDYLTLGDDFDFVLTLASSCISIPVYTFPKGRVSFVNEDLVKGDGSLMLVS